MKKLTLTAWLLVILLAFPSWALATSVYVFSSGLSTEDTKVQTVLEDRFGAGNVFMGVQYINFDGTQVISSYDAVLLLANYNWASGGGNGDMPAGGQQALLDYVNAGHGLVTGEWTIWKTISTAFGTLRDAFPATSPNGAFSTDPSTTYTKVNAPDQVSQGLPTSFTFTLTNIAGTESQLAAKPGAITFYSTSYSGGVGLAGWDYGAGRVASFSTLIGLTELDDPNYQQLLDNTLEWAAQVPVPGAVWLLGSGLLGLAAWGRKFRK
jgi:hypothetical protein